MRKVVLLALITSTIPLSGQSKKFSLEELLPGGAQYSTFQPKKQSIQGWKGDKLVELDTESLFTYDHKGKKSKRPFLTKVTLNKILTSASLDTLATMPRLNFVTPDQARFISDKGITWIDLKNKKVTKHLKMTEGDHSFDFNADASWVTSNQGNALFITSQDGERMEISKDSPKDIVWGQSVHRNEFGIHKGTFWSPNGKKLAFYRMDESMVSPYPLVNTASRTAEGALIRYPMAGTPSHHVTVGIFDTEDQSISYLQTGQPVERYFTNLSWTPDSKSLLIAEVNRAQNEMNLVRYDVSTGKAKQTLFTEKDDKYVEPEHPAFFIPGKENEFIWLSEKDGYTHLYQYNLEGKELKQLTQGEWLVQEVKGIDSNGKYLYYTSTQNSPLESNLYRLDLTNGKIIPLTSQREGSHNIILSPSYKYFFDSYSNINLGNTEVIASTDGKQAVTLFEAPNPVVAYDMPEIEVGTIKADDAKTDLYYRLIKPTDFDPNKKYPAIVYLYNGPHAQMITNTWLAGTRGWDLYMAQKGYVMLTIDGRGSSNRGKDFEQAIHWNLGQAEGKDQMKGIEMLKELGYVDMDRIGIHGWSYGGFMTTHMMLTYPETFKVGVAGGPVMDWKYYEIMYGERYMGHPEENPEGYESTSLIPKAGNLKGRLLLIQGDLDPVVVMQHSLEFIRASVNARVYPDFFIYPGHEHNVLGKDRVHLYEKITRYFEDFL